MNSDRYRGRCRDEMASRRDGEDRVSEATIRKCLLRARRWRELEPLKNASLEPGRERERASLRGCVGVFERACGGRN